ncbi:MAG: SDR family NAD(P)-dependent oxidoreductase [Pseudomonadota bacterium]
MDQQISQARAEVIAVTGGTGFVGGTLINRLLADGKSVRALVRTPEKAKQWQANAGFTAISGDLNDKDALSRLCAGADVLIHGAGVVMARDDADYAKVNADGAGNAAAAAKRSGARVVLLSSMSARFPDVSPYAASKRGGETAVEAETPAFTSLRLPVIYGPGDFGTLSFFVLAERGLALEPATKPPARASILFSEDIADAILEAANAAATKTVHDVGDASPDGYSWGEISAEVARAVEKQTRTLRAPKPIMAAYAGAARQVSRLIGAPPPFRTGQINELYTTDWVARDNLFNSAFDWGPKIALYDGFKQTVRWYRDKGHLAQKPS